MAYTLVPTELIVDGAITSAKLDTNIAISGTLGVTGEVTLATHLVMGDNDKIKIGTGGDLEIYHDGSNSYISNSTGNLYLGDTNGSVHIQAKLNEESIICAADGAVTLYHNNAPKLATTSTGIDVTGTATMDGLTVDGTGSFSSTAPYVDLFETDTTDVNSRIVSNSGSLRLQTVGDNGSGATNRLLIDHATGDISFYEDTGSTAKFFWDASAERLGIGTDSPDTLLNIASSSAPTLRIENTDSTLGLGQVIGAVEFYKTDTSGAGAGVAGGMQLLSTFSTGSKTSLTFSTSNADGNNVERLRIDDSGNLGFTGQLYCNNPNSTLGGFKFFRNHSNGDCYVFDATTAPYAGDLIFGTTNTERMRINATGAITVTETINGFGLKDLGNASLLISQDGGTGTIDGATHNTGFGYAAFNALTSGDYNVALGVEALAANLGGSRNIAIGTYSLSTNQTGNYNTGCGYGTLNQNTVSQNTAMGYEVMLDNTTGDNNAGLGYRALTNNLDGANNTAVGSKSLQANTSADNCTAVGYGALILNESGSDNTAVGRNALDANVSGVNNTAIGESALTTNTASHQTAVGKGAGQSVSSGAENVLVGHEAGRDGNFSACTMVGRRAGAINTGINNTFVGHESGTLMTSGAKNSIIGRFSGNAGGLDMRTASNHIVLSDGDGNVQLYFTNTNDMIVPNLYGSAASQNDVRYNPSSGLMFYNTSSRRYKENIQDIPDGILTKINQARPVTFDEIGTDVQSFGLIAEELDELIPELVTRKEVDGDIVPDGITYSMLSVYLLKAIQEQQTIIDDLKSRIETLEG